jgi:hypothetical protein
MDLPPNDLPPKSTRYDYFDLWTCDGTLENIHPALDGKCREHIGLLLMMVYIWP